MARSLFRDTICLRGPAGLIPLAGAQVWFYEPNGAGVPGPPIAYPLYPDAHSTDHLPVPYVTGALGELEVWADLPHRTQIVAVKPGYAQVSETIDLEYPPELTATTDDIASAILVHEAKDDPHDQYLTQDEGDLRYLSITYTPDLSNYYTKAESDTAFLDQSEGDLRYEQLSRKGAANGYVPLDAGALIPNAYLPPLAITNTFVVVSQAEMLALDAQVGDVCVRLDTTENYILAVEPATVLGNWTKLAASTVSGNTTVVRREEFAPAAAATTVTLVAVPTTILSCSRNGVEQSAAAGHFSVAGVTLTFTDAFVAGERVSVVYEVGSSAPAPINGYTKAESDARYLPLIGGTITGDLIRDGADLTDRTIQFRTAGALRWRLGIIDTQAEGIPDTGGDFKLQYYWSDGAPHDLLTLDRDVGGVEWNLANGAMTYRPGGVGTSIARVFVGANPYTRFNLKADGTMEWGTGTAIPDVTLYRQGGPAGLALTGDFRPNTTNTYDLGLSAARWKKLWATDADFTNAPTVGGSPLPYLPLAGGTLTGALIMSGAGVGVSHAAGSPAFAAGVTGDTFTRTQLSAGGVFSFGPGNAALDTTLQRTSAGALKLDNFLGVRATPGAWRTDLAAIQYGTTAAVMCDTGGGIANYLLSNVMWGATRKAIVTGTGAILQFDGTSGMLFLAAPSVAAGADQTFTTRFTLTPAGNVGVGVTPGAWGSAFKAVQVAGGAALWGNDGASGMWLTSNSIFNGTNRVAYQGGVVGMEMTLGSSGMTVLQYPAVTVGATQTPTSRMNLGTNGDFLIYPDSVSQGFKAATNGATMGCINPSAVGNLFIQTGIGGGYAGSVYFNAAGGMVASQADGGNNLGGASNRWGQIYSVVATISTSHVSLKQDFAPLDPAACVQAVLDTDWLSFEYKPKPWVEPDIQADDPERDAKVASYRDLYAQEVIDSKPGRQQKGYVLGSDEYTTADLFGQADRYSASTHADLAVVACALQEVLHRLAVVEGKVS